MENYAENKVTIVDVKMAFMSMVIFMVKATIAAIPALFNLASLGRLPDRLLRASPLLSR
jgi:hypothetical protein